MEKKENKVLFYIYFIGFLFLAYIGRAILSPTQYHVMPILQIVALLIFPYIWKVVFPKSKLISFIFYYLFFVFLFEMANIVPLFGIFISALLFDETNINLGFSWPFYVLKPGLILGVIYFNRKNLLTYFSAYKAEHVLKVESNLTKEDLDMAGQEVRLKLSETKKIITPQNLQFYIDDIGNMITIILSAGFKLCPHIITLYTNSNQIIWKNNGSGIRLIYLNSVPNVLAIEEKKQITLINMKCFTPTISKAMKNIYEK